MLTSASARWEPYLTPSLSGEGSPSGGTCVWHPPYESLCSVPAEDPRYPSSQDCHISLHNLDAKGKANKLLAKVRLNLSDHYRSRGPASFRLRLRPETSKVEAATVTMTVELVGKNTRLADPSSN